MSTVKVKICGIQDLDTALAAIHAGADFLGFNFVPTSKRYIKPYEAQKIIEKIKDQVKIVGVFQNEDIKKVKKIINILHLDFIQLHGQEDNKYVAEVGSAVIKTINSTNEINDYTVTYFLLDRIEQGKGEVVDSDIAKATASKVPVFLAGGLTLQSVANIVRKIEPFAVDVAGGVETDGAKDIVKIKEFIRNAKGVLI